MRKQHFYDVRINWIGNNGTGTSSYNAYKRDFDISGTDKPTIPGSSDPAFRGDKKRYNPEELLVASLSACHMLWYLHLCAEAGVVVLKYNEHASGVMQETEDGSGFFKEVTLNPAITVSEESMIEAAINLHKKANEMCYIAKSCNFPVHHKPTIST